MPDVERIVRMSELFGVTTDYLLKDAAPEGAPTAAPAAPNARRVSREDAEGAMARQDEYLEKEPFALDADARAAAEAAREEFVLRKTHLEIAGTVLCILSVLPLFAAMGMGLGDFGASAGVAALLVLAGAGAAVFVYSGSCAGAYERLLEEGDFTRARKARSGKKSAFSAAYWLVVTAVFLYYTFGPRGNGQPQYSWIVWAIGGVLFGAAMAIWRLTERKE